MSYTETPTRQQPAWRSDLTPEQHALASQLHTRADRLRAGAAADGESLSIREAVELAAVQLGVAS
jgi:hypothetical protein